MTPIPVEHSYIVPTGQTYYPPGQQQMYPVRQYGHEIFGLDKKSIYIFQKIICNNLIFLDLDHIHMAC